MYKIITHTVREEHFDHPMAIETVNGIKNGNSYTNGNSNSVVSTTSEMLIPGTVSAFNTDPAVIWRMEARTIFDRFLWRMRSYIVGALDSGEDTAVVENQLFQNVNEIGDSVKPYYGLVASKQLAQLLRSFVLANIEFVQTLKKGEQDKLPALLVKINASIDEFADFLSTANSQFWPRDVVVSVIKELVTAWQNQARARLAKNWPVDIESTDTAHRIVSAGQDDGTPAFSEIFAKGIIMQFPDRFVPATTNGMGTI